MPALRQNTTTSIRFGPVVAASDGYTYLATTITLSASNVIIYKADGTVTELVTSAALSMPRPGWLLLNVAASDVTLAGRMTYTMGNATGNLPVWRDFDVVTSQVFDSMNLGNDFLQVDVVQITGAVPSTVLPQTIMDYVMFTPGVQTLTVKDTIKMVAAVLGGKEDGATGTAMRFFGVSGEIRVSAAVVSGKRTGTTWVSG